MNIELPNRCTDKTYTQHTFYLDMYFPILLMDAVVSLYQLISFPITASQSKATRRYCFRQAISRISELDRKN
jgi:hypothetical protein